MPPGPRPAYIQVHSPGVGPVQQGMSLQIWCTGWTTEARLISQYYVGPKEECCGLLQLASSTTI